MILKQDQCSSQAVPSNLVGDVIKEVGAFRKQASLEAWKEDLEYKPDGIFDIAFHFGYYNCMKLV